MLANSNAIREPICQGRRQPLDSQTSEGSDRIMPRASFSFLSRATTVEVVRSPIVDPSLWYWSFPAYSDLDVSGHILSYLSQQRQEDGVEFANYLYPVKLGDGPTSESLLTAIMPAGFLSIALIMHLDDGDQNTPSTQMTPTLSLIGDPNVIGSESIELPGWALPLTGDPQEDVRTALSQFSEILHSA